MALETASFINGLVASNPAGTDNEAQGADHLRLIKAVLLATFPNLTGAMTATQAALNVIQTNSAGTALRSNGAIPVGSAHWFFHGPGTSIMASGGTATGTEQYIECDGASYATSLFPDLAASGQVVVSGGNFTVPLMTDTGRFMRSRSISLGYSPGAVQSNQNAAHTHTLTDPGHTHANTLTDPGHTHTITDPGHAHSITMSFPNGASGGPVQVAEAVNNYNTNTAFTGITNVAATTGVSINNVSHTTGITMASQGGSEARPEALVAICCIKT